MGRQHSNVQHQFEKQKLFNIKITTRIRGDVKNKFMHDCFLKGVSESELAREIISLHYQIIEHYQLHQKDLDEIKKILTK